MFYKILPIELIQYILKIKYWSYRRRILLYIPRPYTVLHKCFLMNPYYYLAYYETTINLGNYLLVYRVDDDLDIRVVLLKKRNRLQHWETLFFYNID